MILDQLSATATYLGLGDRFTSGLSWIAGFSPQMTDGRYPIAGDDLFALVQSYETVPAVEKKYEAHRLYADIQFVAVGSEVIYYAPLAALQVVTGYDADRDFMLFSDPPAATPLHLAAGTFAIFYPQDGHKPGCMNGGPSAIKKVVIKVRI